MFTTYHDFEIAIEPGKSNRFPFSVSGPGGDARGILRLPTNNATYQGLARRLEALDTDETMLVQIGQILFDMLFQGQVKEMYRASQGMLQPDEGLRIRLSLGAAQGEVAALPWELLTDPDQGPLALLDAPIVRYLQQPARLPTLATQLPLKVLVTGAQTPPVTDVQRELQLVKTALEGLGQHVNIEVVEHLTPSGLQQHLRAGFHVWHFVGHGGSTEDGKTAQLYFEDANGDAQPVSALQLKSLLYRSTVRLIVLDACNSAHIATDPFHSLAPALIQAQIPAVIAMQFTVPEDTTKAFASEFYKALAEGFPIDACVTEGRKAVMNETGLNNPDWGIPVVYTRAPDGKLFDLPAAPALQADSSPASQGADGGRTGGQAQDSSRSGSKTADQPAGVPAQGDVSEQGRRTMLRQRLETYFNESELRNLSFDLGVDYESLPGEGKASKARELVAYCERHGLTSRLIALCAQLRPNLSWGNVSTQSGSTGASGTGTTEAAERAEEVKRLRAKLKVNKDRLFQRELQKATYGISADPSILIDIENLEREIADLNRQIQELGG